MRSELRADIERLPKREPVRVRCKGGLDARVLYIPDDIELYPRIAFVQGFTWSAYSVLRLCNALELALGARL